jgi:hypothetical protein
VKNDCYAPYGAIKPRDKLRENTELKNFLSFLPNGSKKLFWGKVWFLRGIWGIRDMTGRKNNTLREVV